MGLACAPAQIHKRPKEIHALNRKDIVSLAQTKQINISAFNNGCY